MTDRVPLGLVPAWRRPAFWILFALGAFWGAVLGSAVAAEPFVWALVLRTPVHTPTQADVAIFGVLANAPRTQLRATVIVWTFTLAGGFVTAGLGLRWLRRREPGGWPEGLL